MRYFILICFFILFGLGLKGQSAAKAYEGSVSFISSQNVYVKFKSTKHISVGDTLFIEQMGQLIPALKVNNLSSISCVCDPISSIKLSIGDKLISKKQIQKEVKTVESIKKTEEKPIISTPSSVVPIVKDKEYINKQDVHGRFSVASYSNFSNTQGGNSQRMRYTFSLTANHMNDSKFSVENYISFSHRAKHWDEIKENIFNGLKIYSFALKYEPTENLSIWFGRKINPKISSIGAIDGLQIEKKINNFTLGAFVGMRPDYMDYGFNTNLLQFGAYVNHFYKGKHGIVENTLAFVEQKNNGKTDRRIAYFQHSNSLLKSLYFFGTAELEMYQKINEVAQSKLKISNLYLMLRYRVIKQLSFSLSYNERSNIIYYETYKDYVQQLIDDQTMQGFKFQVNVRPFKNVSMGLNAGYRSRKQDPTASKNIHSYLSFNHVPGIDAAVRLSATFLKSSYLTGSIYSLNISRDLVAGKLYSSISYRYVDYNYVNYNSTLVQHVGDINLNWKLMKKTSLSISYESIFEKENRYSRLYLNLIKRF